LFPCTRPQLGPSEGIPQMSNGSRCPGVADSQVLLSLYLDALSLETKTWSGFHAKQFGFFAKIRQ
jgi:hypothetical protein